MDSNLAPEQAVPDFPLARHSPFASFGGRCEGHLRMRNGRGRAHQSITCAPAAPRVPRDDAHTQFGRSSACSQIVVAGRRYASLLTSRAPIKRGDWPLARSRGHIDLIDGDRESVFANRRLPWQRQHALQHQNVARRLAARCKQPCKRLGCSKSAAFSGNKRRRPNRHIHA